MNFSFMAVLLVAAAAMVLVFPAPAHSSAPPQTSFPVERFVIDLDLPPQQRWSHVMPTYEGQIEHMFNFVTGFIPSFIRSEVMEAMATVGEALEFFLGVYGLEIQGIADVVGLPAGDIALINILYEMVSMCTSIVAESSDGRILHSRNLDFGLGTEFTTLLQNLTLQVEFQKGGKTVYYGTTYAGYVGLLTGMAPGKFGISLNLRHSGDIMGNVRELLANPGANVVSFLLRRVLETQPDYAAALKRLVTEPLISESYIILSGIASGQGAVITRNRTIAADVWTLGGSQNDSWFLLQTNHDHWLPSPPGDHRTDVGMRAMDAIGPDRISLENLYEVLSTKPLLNAQTTYTTSMAPYNATYTTYMRICPPPCTLHAPLPPPAWTRSRQ